MSAKRRTLLVGMAALLAAVAAVAGPMDRGSISPGGWIGLDGNWDLSAEHLEGGVSVAPGIECAIARNAFVGADVSLAGGLYSQYGQGTTFKYGAFGLGPVVRLCFGTAPSWSFVWLEPSVSVTTTSGSYTDLGACLAGSVGLLTMLGHGVALEPALTGRWKMMRTGYSIGDGASNSGLSVSAGVGLRSYIYK
jgi:hypothetical protein